MMIEELKKTIVRLEGEVAELKANQA